MAVRVHAAIADMAARRQPEVGAQAARALEPGRIIDGRHGRYVAFDRTKRGGRPEGVQ